LKEEGEWDDTLVIFFSDNGANGLQMHQYPGTDQAWVERNSDNRFENLGRQYSRMAAGPAWAQVSMVPFRLFKGTHAEGGIRSPLVIRGPGVAREWRLRNQWRPLGWLPRHGRTSMASGSPSRRAKRRW